MTPSSSATIVVGNTQTCSFASNTLTCTEKAYKTVVIGTQTWMAENLNYGTMVLGAAGHVNDASVEKFCYSDNTANCTTDGGLYTWAEAMSLPSICNSVTCASQISNGNHQGICPTGWHIPKKAEWDVLATHLGGSSVAGKKMKLNGTAYSSWDATTYNDGNSSGFSAFPAGNSNPYGDFNNRGNSTQFWEARENNASVAYKRHLNAANSDLNALSADNKFYSISVRCLKDN